MMMIYLQLIKVTSILMAQWGEGFQTTVPSVLILKVHCNSMHTVNGIFLCRLISQCPYGI